MNAWRYAGSSAWSSSDWDSIWMVARDCGSSGSSNASSRLMASRCPSNAVSICETSHWMLTQFECGLFAEVNRGWSKRL